MTSVALADDQAPMRGALKTLPELEGNLEVVGEADTGEELLATVAKVTPATTVVDIEISDLDRIGATAKARAAYPQTRVLILTTFGCPGYSHRALEAGASGSMVKDTPSQGLARTVHKIAAGGRVVDPKLAAESLFEGENLLTPREQEVLRKAEASHHTATIAKTIYLSPGTVCNYPSSAINKTRTDTSTGAVRYARDQDWL